ncbi:MAG: hypothetical protein EBS51_10065, partial [Planctomycetia bacterium]|nr:hypothetical protein [Planctomycetia bacterium]
MHDAAQSHEPSAKRHRPATPTVFGAAFVAGAVAAFGINSFFDAHVARSRPQVESEPIFVALRSLPQGAPVTVWDVALRDWPRAMLPESALRAEDRFEGCVLRHPLREGQPLLSVQLARPEGSAGTFPSSLTEALAAVSIAPPTEPQETFTPPVAAAPVEAHPVATAPLAPMSVPAAGIPSRALPPREAVEVFAPVEPARAAEVTEAASGIETGNATAPAVVPVTDVPAGTVTQPVTSAATDQEGAIGIDNAVPDDSERVTTTSEPSPTPVDPIPSDREAMPADPVVADDTPTDAAIPVAEVPDADALDSAVTSNAAPVMPAPLATGLTPIEPVAAEPPMGTDTVVSAPGFDDQVNETTEVRPLPPVAGPIGGSRQRPPVPPAPGSDIEGPLAVASRQRAAQTVSLRQQNRSLKTQLDAAYGVDGIVGQSPAIQQVLRTIHQVAPSTIPVLITGESGTGKELVAAAIHRHSKRKEKRYVTFNAAGQAESLLEDQLFGHVRGAFTGADRDREGVFEYADKGTVFLDEIG